MKIIIAPHPDDEWIGCGCTMLKSIKNSEKITVLVITRPPKIQRRIKISKKLAEKYKYKIKFLMEKEKQINDKKLEDFLKKNVSAKDVIYVPDLDIHPDHRKISKASQKFLKNKMYQYCVYNNSLNPFKRILNIILKIISGNATSSFRRGKEDFKEDYRLETKNKYIIEFGENKRGPDVMRRIK